MSAVLEVASLLIDKLHTLLDMLHQYTNFDSPEKTYKAIFEMFYQASYHKPLLKSLHKDARLLKILQYVRELLNIVNDVISERNIDIFALAREILRRAYTKLAETSENMPRYVIICDGLSIIDAMYIAYRLKKEGMKPSIIPLINPGGVTETYKFILEPHSYIQNINLTLNVIAHRIAEKIHAKDYEVFKEYDELIHQLKNVHAIDIIKKMYKLNSDLCNKITRLKKDFNSTIMILSDHGYDITEKSNGFYDVNHLWGPRSFSVIASLLII